ncbi:MAG: DUF4917 family protein [Pseudomonadota bacterium]
MELMTFVEVATSLRKKNRAMSLLLGNGFSMSYDPNIFSYNALYTFLTSQEDNLLNKLFGVIKTKNFELVMQQLDVTIALLEAFGIDTALQEQIRSASQRLRNALLSSVKELHPEHVYKMPEERSTACANFLRLFLESGGGIYTTNYDLLLYWVLMRQGVPNPVDGFGRELENPVEAAEGGDQEWSDLIWGPNKSDQNIHYLHGALHLFDSGTDVVKEQYDRNGYLLDNINSRLDQGSYPIFVTAGNGDEKLEHIRHNRYLSHCYDRLCEVDGSLVTFGFGFGQYDEHIIEAINKAAKFSSKKSPKLWSIYIGVYSEADIKHVESIEKKFHPKVRLFDARTANVWGA